jgi:hypothetical protein
MIRCFNHKAETVNSFSLRRFLFFFPGEILPTTHMVYLLSEGALLKFLSGLRTTRHTCRRIWGWEFVRLMQIEFWYACWGKFCSLHSHDGINKSKYIASKNTLIVNRKGYENEWMRVNLIHCCSSCQSVVGKPPETSGLSVSLVAIEKGHFPYYKLRQH